MENEEGENNPNEAIVESADRPLTKRERRELAKQKKREEHSKSLLKNKVRKIVSFAIWFVVLAFIGYKGWQWIITPQEGYDSADILSVKSDDWVKGKGDAKVTLIEYADFECPACKIYSTDVLPKLENDYKDSLRIVSRHFPLPQHTKAIDAAKAAEAAGKQGKFWDMYKLLYDKQEDWVEGNLKEKLLSYADSLGLDRKQFESDFDSEETSQSIKKDEAEGYTLKINSTPTFYVNGKKANINNGYDDLKKAIDQELSLNK